MKGKNYNVEEVIRHLEAQEHLDEQKALKVLSNPDMDFIRQSELIRGSSDKVEIALGTDIEKQSSAVHGHKVSTDELNKQWKNSEHLSDVYDDYLRTYQLAAESAAAGKLMKTVHGALIDTMTFLDWVNECKMTQQWRIKEELPKLKKTKKISKENYEMGMYVASKCLEAYEVYLNASDKQKLILV